MDHKKVAGNNNWKIMVAVVAVALILFVGWWLLYKKSGSFPSGYQGGTDGLGASDGPGGTAAPRGPATRLPASSGIPVPNATSSNVPANVAKPSVVIPAAPNSSANFRKFSISVGGNQFIPSNVIVNAGDTVHLDIVAVDNNYNFTQPDYGFNVNLPRGQTKVVEFQATAAGKFTFYCKSCGGPAKGPVGYITVVAK